jgi:hypothetical protein
MLSQLGKDFFKSQWIYAGHAMMLVRSAAALADMTWDASSW